MADLKISALPASTTPLAGTEVFPIVQGGATVKVSVANLTAGRAFSATQMTLTTGNLIVASGQGIDFSATPGTGTSELLNDYEEGTWTPSLGGTSSLTVNSATYVRVGRLVYVETTFTVTSLGTGNNYIITGAPFNPANSTAMTVGYFAFISSAASSLYSYMDNSGQWVVAPLVIPSVTVSVSNAVFATGTIMRVSGSYQV